jgi:ankyrin repeat protein
VRLLLDLGLDANQPNREGRTPLMGAALKGRNEVVQMLVAAGAKLETLDGGSRDTDNSVSVLAGHRWQAIDYADGLVRVGVQSAIARPESHPSALRPCRRIRCKSWHCVQVLSRISLPGPSGSGPCIRTK